MLSLIFVYFTCMRSSMMQSQFVMLYSDLWWDDHQKSCGGTFIKIKEPENYGKKTSKSGQYCVLSFAAIRIDSQV